VEYLATVPDDDREFVPTAELIEALNVEPIEVARQMSDLGCRPTRDRITEDGRARQVRGYHLADINTAAEAIRSRESNVEGCGAHPSHATRRPSHPV
jgi:DNA segregation ATPase FtsK/SpoIIIE, S-DNA-T family